MLTLQRYKQFFKYKTFSDFFFEKFLCCKTFEIFKLFNYKIFEISKIFYIKERVSINFGRFVDNLASYVSYWYV